MLPSCCSSLSLSHNCPCPVNWLCHVGTRWPGGGSSMEWTAGTDTRRAERALTVRCVRDLVTLTRVVAALRRPHVPPAAPPGRPEAHDRHVDMSAGGARA